MPRTLRPEPDANTSPYLRREALSRGRRVAGSVGGARLAQCLEGGREAAALGEAVPAEAELVRPPTRPLSVDLLAITGVPGRADQPTRVLAAAQVLQLVRLLDPVADPARVLGRLGRVLGDVSRDARGLARLASQVEHAYLVLTAPRVGVVALVLGRG